MIDLPDDPSENDPFGDAGSSDKEGRPGILPDFVRRAAVAGLGALFMTEEGVRGLAGQLKLPKEMLGFLISQAEKTKDDVSRVVTEEVRRFLQSERLRDEIMRLMAGMTVEVKAQIRLVPDKPPSVAITELTAKRQGHHKKGKKE